jgi:hypothetical protein
MALLLVFTYATTALRNKEKKGTLFLVNLINQLKQELTDDSISSLSRTVDFLLQLDHLGFLNFSSSEKFQIQDDQVEF